MSSSKLFAGAFAVFVAGDRSAVQAIASSPSRRNGTLRDGTACAGIPGQEARSCGEYRVVVNRRSLTPGETESPLGGSQFQLRCALQPATSSHAFSCFELSESSADFANKAAVHYLGCILRFTFFGRFAMH